MTCKLKKLEKELHGRELKHFENYIKLSREEKSRHHKEKEHKTCSHENHPHHKF